MLQYIHTIFTMNDLSFTLLKLNFLDLCLANCNFDTGTICKYQNGAGQFNWEVQKGINPRTGTGPTYDVSGTGKWLILL